MEPLIQVKILETEDKKAPFEEWYFSLRDKTTRVRIQTRLDRLIMGNFGDVKSLEEGVFELRLHFGSGYRVYFAKVGGIMIVLLGGGDKDTQERDIERAKLLWRRYKNETQRYERDFET